MCCAYRPPMPIGTGSSKGVDAPVWALAKPTGAPLEEPSHHIQTQDSALAR